MDSVYFRSSFWNDLYVLSLDKDTRIVYIYLFTNKLIKSSGIYEFYIEDIQRRTGVKKKKIEIALKELEKSEKIYVVKGWVFIVNFLKKTFNFPQSVLSKNIKRSITNQFNYGNVPLELIACFLKEYQTLYQTLSQDLNQALLIRIKDLGLRIKDLDTPPTPPGGSEKGYTPKFEELWKHYPRKLGKEFALATYNAKLKQGAKYEHLLQAVKHYAKLCQVTGKEQKHILHLKTFFGPKNPWKEFVNGIPDGELPQEQPHGASKQGDRPEPVHKCKWTPGLPKQRP